MKYLVDRYNALDTNNMYTMACFQTLLIILIKNLGNSHIYNTRNTINFRIEVKIHKIKSVMSAGPKFWKSLPNELK